MSIYKGTQLIAANGAPGLPGANGRDGINGNGVLVVDTCTEISNNVDAHGASGNTGGNYVNGNQQWCKVGGYHSGLDGTTGQASEVFGYDCHLGGGTGVHVEGYRCGLDHGAQGTHVEGCYNGSVQLGNGSHLEGFNNGFSGITNYRGVHIEGSEHTGVSVRLSDGAHIGGYGLTEDTPTLSMPYQRSDSGGNYESTYIEAIGLKTSGNGEYARVMRNDGSMAIGGDMAFTALDSSGHSLGRFTLGEIVEALINAGILYPPV